MIKVTMYVVVNDLVTTKMYVSPLFWRKAEADAWLAREENRIYRLDGGTVIPRTVTVEK